jgi:hypothetical protein
MESSMAGERGKFSLVPPKQHAASMTPEKKRVISPPVSVWVDRRERGGIRVVSSVASP